MVRGVCGVFEFVSRADQLAACLTVGCPACLFADRYKCERCVEYNGTVEESEQRPTSFNAWDVGCLDRLPDYVSKEFPFILTRRSGIDIRLVDRLADDLVHGKGFSAAAKYIRQVNLRAILSFGQVTFAETMFPVSSTTCRSETCCITPSRPKFIACSIICAGTHDKVYGESTEVRVTG